ncbi:MAG: ABC transporter ATP-binding protein, partial [Nitrosopumilus sp.]|nr:ABC transporter ATP-binding protein [Nitrosopumilus sp.]
MMNLIVDSLSAIYSSSEGPVYAVDDVSFEIKDDESIGIAGESACGKSTLGLSLIRMLSGGKAAGKILFDNESTLELSESEFNSKYRWKKISMIFQGAMNSLDPVFTIKEQFLEIIRQHDFEGDSDKMIYDSINSVSLDESILKKYPHELSGGMK